MTPERKAELPIKGKKRWADSKIIAERLSMRTEQVYVAYATIVRANLLEIALKPDATVDEMQSVIAIINQKATVRIHEEESKEDLMSTPADQIRGAMWLIRKIGSLEQAIKAVKAAALAIKELEKN